MAIKNLVIGFPKKKNSLQASIVGGTLLLVIIGGLSTYSLQLLAKTCEVARALPEQETDSDAEDEGGDGGDGDDAGDAGAADEPARHSQGPPPQQETTSVADTARQEAEAMTMMRLLLHRLESFLP